VCGITGVLGAAPEARGSLLDRMADSLRHRGPDDRGVWYDDEAEIGLAHRRLAIVDLSAAGAQPMISHCGRRVLCFNGEIYNHAALRTELDAACAPPWRGHSDTEVLLAAIGHWGLQGTLDRSDGMFAFALWDRENHELAVARDRTGEKPLYVGWVGSSIVFASELRALRQHPAWRGGVDARALRLMLELGYVPAPLSIHPRVYKLPAGSLLRLRSSDAEAVPTAEAFASRCERYWNLAEVALTARGDPWPGSREQALDTLQELLDSSVSRRMIADVPLGALLSGGIDSTLVVASMQAQSSAPVRTFTVAFRERAVDESEHARRIAAHLRTNHTEVELPPDRALAIVERLPDIYDEPFADAAAIPAVLVSEIARRHITVALTGDGGDELFHGYQRYLDVERIWSKIGAWPPGLRRVLAAGCATLARFPGIGTAAERLVRQSARVGAADAEDYYARVLSFGERSTEQALVRSDSLVWPTAPPSLAALAERMRFVDQGLGLPEGIHTKLDRASMAAALELRVPLLDPRIVKFAWRMPQARLASGGRGKTLLRELVRRRVPAELVDRPKQGFDVPIAAWLRGPLRDWAGDLLASAAVRQDPLLDAPAVAAMFDAHLARRADYGYALWALAMYRAWYRRHES
jgi:asparagine synthase (glutamine-hydrolysing)